jgi:hypothetical protein
MLIARGTATGGGVWIVRRDDRGLVSLTIGYPGLRMDIHTLSNASAEQLGEALIQASGRQPDGLSERGA